MHSMRVRDDDNLRTTIDMLASSRAAFSRAEADQSLRRALSSPPSRINKVLCPMGSEVDYWVDGFNPDRRGWRGQAFVTGQVGKQVPIRHGSAWTTRHTDTLRRSGKPQADDSANVEMPAETPGVLGSPPSTDRTPTTAEAGDVTDKLRRAAAALEANANVAAAVAADGAVGWEAGHAAAAESERDGDCGIQVGRHPPCPTVRFLFEPHPGDSLPLGRLTGQALVHSLRGGSTNLDAQMEEVHAQWHHAPAAVTISRLRLHGVLNGAVLLRAAGVADACPDCAGRADHELVGGATGGVGGATTSWPGPEDDTLGSYCRASACGSRPEIGATDDGSQALRSYAALSTRREKRRRAEVPMGEAGSRFDAAIESKLDAWTQRSVYTEHPDQGQRVLLTR